MLSPWYLDLPKTVKLENVPIISGINANYLAQMTEEDCGLCTFLDL